MKLLMAHTVPVVGYYIWYQKDGAGDEIRTHDFNLGKVALYP